jgi:hypothetical protein
MEVAFPDPPSDPAIDAAAAQAAADALRKSGFRSLEELFEARGEDADELLATLRAIAARDMSSKAN